MSVSWRKKISLGIEGARFLSHVHAQVRNARREKPQGMLLPWMLYVQTTNRCNASCSICPYPRLYRNKPAEEMAQGLFRKLMRESSGPGASRTIAFGLHCEPLLDPRLPSFIAQAKEAGMVSMVFTNGQLLEGALAKGLAGSGLDYIRVSLPSLDKDVFGKISTGLDLDRVIGNIKGFVRIAGDSVVVRVGITVTRENKDTSALVRRVKEWGAYPQLHVVHNRCGELEKFSAFSASSGVPGSGQGLVRRLVFKGCWFPYYCAGITCRGKVLMCCNDWAHSMPLGDMQGDTLRQIWNGPQAIRVRTLVAQARYREVPLCGACSAASG